MDNNNNNKNAELIGKLNREIWLFEQWLTAVDDQAGETQKRIKVAYQECIASRKAKVFELESQQTAQQLEKNSNIINEALEA